MRHSIIGAMPDLASQPMGGEDRAHRFGRRFLAEFAGGLVDRRGVSGAEYAILAVAIVIVVGFAAATLGSPTKNALVRVGTTIAQTQASLSSNLASAVR